MYWKDREGSAEQQRQLKNTFVVFLVLCHQVIYVMVGDPEQMLRSGNDLQKYSVWPA